ncbi:MAG: hypothetical protein ACHQ7N_21925 [Candidatus Methylomirabilales bacterium]
MAELAGAIKVVEKMSLADCFAAALATWEKAEIFTGAPEFEMVEKDVKVVWLQPMNQMGEHMTRRVRRGNNLR